MGVVICAIIKSVGKFVLKIQANGGLGSAFDELMLNHCLCQHHGVRIAGVIINKVIPAKYEQTKNYMSKALMFNWGVPLCKFWYSYCFPMIRLILSYLHRGLSFFLICHRVRGSFGMQVGCIPDRHFLGCPAIADLERLFKTKLLAGQAHVMKHYSVSEINLVTTSLGTFMETLRSKPSRTLYLCHVTRNDVILGFLGEYQRRLQIGESFESTLVLCGRSGHYNLSEDMEEMIKSWGAPVLHVGYSTHQAMEMIDNYTPKLNSDDTHRVQDAIEHYEKYIDFDQVLQRISDKEDV
mmetsp:Transcript_19156/g.43614  ORF Transcript_19156/g.43614 Transcript_19156/m.43614 type:complete len:295 (-) Transcript_19156:94-978(-)